MNKLYINSTYFTSILALIIALVLVSMSCLSYVDPTISSSSDADINNRIDGEASAPANVNKDAIALFKKYGWKLGNVSFSEATATNVFSTKQWAAIEKASNRIGYKKKIDAKSAKVYFVEELRPLDGEDEVYFRVFTVITDKNDRIVGACIVLRSNVNSILDDAFDNEEDYTKALNKKWICSLKTKSKTMDATMRKYYNQYIE